MMLSKRNVLFAQHEEGFRGYFQDLKILFNYNFATSDCIMKLLMLSLHATTKS